MIFSKPTDRLLFNTVIYDMTSKLEFNLAYRIVGIDATPFCLHYW